MKFQIASVRMRIVTLCSLAVIVLTVATATLLLGASPLSNRDDVAIKSVCLNAVVAEQTVGVPPSTYAGGPMSRSMQSAMLASGRAALGRYYMGSALTLEVSELSGAIHGLVPGTLRALGGGVHWMTYPSITVNGSTATVHAQAETWARVGEVVPGGKLAVATPHNVIDYTFTLAKQQGHWFIISETWQFAPGSEP